MAVNYDALINQINSEQAKQEQAAREANALLEKQAAAKKDQLMNTYAAQEANQRRNYNTLVEQADKQLTKDGAAAYQSMLVARNPFGTNAERLRNNGMSEYMNTAAYNTYRGDYNNAKNTRDTNVNNYNIALENYMSELNANRANAQKEYDIALLNAQNELQQQLANLQAQYGQQRLQMQKAKAQAEAQAAAARASARRSSSGSSGGGSYVYAGDENGKPSALGVLQSLGFFIKAANSGGTSAKSSTDWGALAQQAGAIAKKYNITPYKYDPRSDVQYKIKQYQR